MDKQFCVWYRCYAIAEHAYSSQLCDDAKDDWRSGALRLSHVQQNTTNKVTSAGKPNGPALTDWPSTRLHTVGRPRTTAAKGEQWQAWLCLRLPTHPPQDYRHCYMPQQHTPFLLTKIRNLLVKTCSGYLEDRDHIPQGMRASSTGAWPPFGPRTFYT